MITVENVSKQYGSNSVLRGISVQLHEGAIYGLVGANGCGKTTLHLRFLPADVRVCRRQRLPDRRQVRAQAES